MLDSSEDFATMQEFTHGALYAPRAISLYLVLQGACSDAGESGVYTEDSCLILPKQGCHVCGSRALTPRENFGGLEHFCPAAQFSDCGVNQPIRSYGN